MPNNMWKIFVLAVILHAFIFSPVFLRLNLAVAQAQTLPALQMPPLPPEIEDALKKGIVERIVGGFKAEFERFWLPASQWLERAVKALGGLNFGSFDGIVKQRIDIFKQEFPKEWQEMKDDVRRIIPLLPGLWDKLKEII